MIRSETYNSWIARYPGAEEYPSIHPSGCFVQVSVGAWKSQVVSLFLSLYGPDKRFVFERVLSDDDICEALGLSEISIQQALAFGLNEVESYAERNFR